MRASTKRIVSFLLSIVLFVVSFAIYSILLRPEYARVNALRGDLASKAEFLEREQTIVNKVQDLLLQYQGAISLEDTISRALPRNESISSLTNQLIAISKNAGLDILSFSLNTAPLRIGGGASVGNIGSKIGTVSIQMSLAGPYEGIKLFLQTLETNIRVMDLVDLSVIRRQSETLEYSLKIDSYYQSQ